MNKYQAIFLQKSSDYGNKYDINDPDLWGAVQILRDNFTVEELLYRLNKKSGLGGNHTSVTVHNNIATISSILFDEDDEINIPLDKFMKFLHD